MAQDNYFTDIRKKFFDFWRERGHVVVPSSSLLPDDPSVLLTTAGMQQFKRYYTGKLNPLSDFGSARATSIQKCFRTSDIEEVGDTTHLTFFEMMGNFSFGPVGDDNPSDRDKKGYFKRAAIVWAWEFLTEALAIEPDRIFVTVFEGDNDTPKDTEAYDIWKNEIGLPEERIGEGCREDNFWGPTGDEGPCGPTTELYVAKTPKEAFKGEGVEVWNVVFNEYIKTKNGVYTKAPVPGIDTGMGFERLLAVVEGVDNVFETEAFVDIMEAVHEYAPGVDEATARLLADHIRGAVFLIGDEVTPSNKEAGYVLRRLLRRVIAISVEQDIHTDIFEEVYRVIVKQYSSFYPEIAEEKKILLVWREEKQRFSGVIANGMRRLAKALENAHRKKEAPHISGETLFEYYTTYGVPPEMARDMASRIGFAVDNGAMKEFEKAFAKHQDISRAGVDKKFGGHGLLLDTGELKATDKEEMQKVLRLHTSTHLLQWALRQVLGESVHQMGSDITAKRLRFDFAFDRKMKDEEKAEVEAKVNEKIKEDLPVTFKEMPKDEAEKEGALAFFKEKYPDIVKVYTIGTEGNVISKELCGGPHVTSTGQIGHFTITKEESVGRGVRRIRANVS